MKTVLLCLLFYFASEHASNGCKSSSIQNVIFDTKNFIYLLQWKDKDLNLNATFSVQYKWYGDKEWLMKKGCQNITIPFCNLTDEIIGDLDKFIEFFGRVKAVSNNCSSDWVMSKRLDPREDTYIDILDLNIIENVRTAEIVVNVPSPLINTTFSKQNTIEYYLNFGSTEEVTRQKIQTNNTFTMTGLYPNTKYNGSVYITINHKRKSDIKMFVFKTLQDPPVLGLLVSLLLFAGLLSLGLLYICWRYVKQHGKTPNALVFEKQCIFQAIDLPKEKENILYPTSAHLKEQWLGKCEILTPNTGQNAYKTQFENPPTKENNNSLPSSFSYTAHQEEPTNTNKTMDSSVDYGVFEHRTPYKSNSLLIDFRMQLDHHEISGDLTSHDLAETVLVEETAKELNEPLMLKVAVNGSELPQLTSDINTFNPHILLSTVIVSYETDEKEKQKSSLHLNLKECEDRMEYDNTTDKILDNSSLPYEGNYKRSFQIPVNHTVLNGLENIWHCQQPYSQQH
uniref:Fibronectin type-III domain-containing protein n=1 Tax=Leptobrachium leishanense TaxID=445787 RepID=A0A8C5MQW2_9ANUR